MWAKHCFLCPSKISNHSYLLFQRSTSIWLASAICWTQLLENSKMLLNAWDMCSVSSASLKNVCQLDRAVSLSNIVIILFLTNFFLNFSSYKFTLTEKLTCEHCSYSWNTYTERLEVILSLGFPEADTSLQELFDGITRQYHMPDLDCPQW